MNGLKPMCPYCQRFAELVGGDAIYPHRPDLFDLKFWRCEPCDAYVGCHKANIRYGDGTRPLGRLADAELRHMKNRAHTAFDPLWKQGHFKGRRQAYGWLAVQLRKPVEDTHIGMFDVAECAEVIRLCQQFLRESNTRARQ